MPSSEAALASIQDHLVDATTQVLETMFFASVFGPAEAAPIDPAETRTVHLLFEGPVHGRFVAAVQSDLARTLAADFLGLGPGEELDDQRVEDVIGELGNMLCGATLSKLGHGSAFTLSHPESGSPPEPLAGAATLEQALDLGDGTLLLRWEVA